MKKKRQWLRLLTKQMHQPKTGGLQKYLRHWLFDWAETIVVALVLALIIRAFFLQIFWIPSTSMVPNLNIKDRIVTNKLLYYFREPKRFETIVFRQVAAEDVPKKDLIKRVVGLPGEILELKQGVLYINGKELKIPHVINQDSMSFGPVLIPAENYFVMGDNRPVSADSRYWGFLPRKNIIGPAFAIIWPLNKIGFIP